MALGLRLYLAVVAAYLAFCFSVGCTLSTELVLVAALFCLSCFACYVGIAPHWLASIIARILRFPRELVHRWKGQRPFNYHVVTENLLIGRLPRSRSDLELLREKHNVCAVVDMTQSWEQTIHEQVFSELKILRINLPTPDYSCPTFESLLLAIEFINTHSINGAVYVHCNGGKGRAAAVVAGWLMHHQRISALQVEQLLLSRRPVTPMSKWGHLRPTWRLLQRYQTHLKITST
eukprot:m.34880 g.34880  ORF g.34880 m.34880 type:complete len:234 (-) comp11071_c0_seq1:423-1124(-)